MIHLRELVEACLDLALGRRALQVECCIVVLTGIDAFHLLAEGAQIMAELLAYRRQQH